MCVKLTPFVCGHLHLFLSLPLNNFVYMSASMCARVIIFVCVTTFSICVFVRLCVATAFILDNELYDLGAGDEA